MNALKRTTSVLLLAVMGLSGCASIEARNVSERVSQCFVTIEEVANETAILCGHSVINGPCADGATVTTSDKQNVQDALNRVYDFCDEASDFVGVGDALQAQDRLTQATLILTSIRGFLAGGAP